MDESQVLALVQGVHETSLDPDRWPDILDRIADAFGCHFGMFNIERLGHGRLKASSRFDPERAALYGEYYSRINPWRGHLDQPFPVGACSLNRKKRLIPRRDLVRSEFFADYFTPMHLRYAIGVTLARHAGQAVGLTLAGPREFEDYTEDDRRLMNALIPHLQLAVRVQSRLGQLESRAGHLEEALDRSPLGAILLDGSGWIRFANHTARLLLQARDGLCDEGGILRAQRAADDRGLRGAILAALTTHGGAGLAEVKAATVHRPSGRWPYEVLVTPLPTAGAWLLDDGGGALVLVGDPAGEVADIRSVLREVYGLTPAESELSYALVNGWTLAAVASATGRSAETLRSQLKAVFEKTGARRQVDLVRVLLRGPAHMVPRNGAAMASEVGR